MQTDPDLLITADAMPKLRGETIARRLAERRVTYPIIVISAWHPEKWVQELADKGLNIAILSMPFVLEEIRRLLEYSLQIRP